jgi:glycosyltransferase involved in cell wall biosynthesis
VERVRREALRSESVKICLISDEHFPFKGADTEVIVNTAAALGDAGATVALATPWLWHKHSSLDVISEYYGVPKSFKHVPIITPLPPERTLRSQQLLHWLLTPLSRTFWAADVIHTRDHAPLALCHLLRRPWSYETYRRHYQEAPWLARWTRRLNFNRSIGGVAHSSQARADLIALGLPEESVIVSRPGFNRSVYSGLPTSRDARAQLGLPAEGHIVGYVGNIGPGKGVEACVSAMTSIQDALLLIVGGSPQEVEALNAQIPSHQRARVHMTGHQPSARVSLYLAACDVALIPPLYRNSRGPLLDRILPKVLPGPPLKIYGYWASERVIVAADQAHATELLTHERTAILYDPDDPEQFSRAIRRALSEPELSRALVTQGAQKVQEITYSRRAQEMLTLFDRRLSVLGRSATTR